METAKEEKVVGRAGNRDTKAGNAREERANGGKARANVIRKEKERLPHENV